MPQLSRAAALALVLLLLPAVASSVVEVDERGFVVSHELVMAGSTDEVYRQLVDHVGEWWHPSHSWSGDAAKMSIEARAGGCFCERWEGNEVEHLRVVQALPGRMLRLAGALGPLSAEALSGSMTIEFEAADGGTTVRLRYAVAGVWPGGFEQVAPAVDGVLAQQLQRLANFVATGSPEAP